MDCQFINFIEMEEQEYSFSNGFIDHFEAEGVQFMIQVKHFLSLSQEEIEKFKVDDGQFLVHLFSEAHCKSFKVFLDDGLNWVSDQDDSFVYREYVEIIGSIIDEYTLLNKW